MIAAVMILALLAAIAAGVVLSDRSPKEDLRACGPLGSRASIAGQLSVALATIRSTLTPASTQTAQRQEVTNLAARVDLLTHRFALLSSSADTEAQDRELAAALAGAKKSASELAIALRTTGSTATGMRSLDSSAAHLRAANVTASPCADR